jgi:histone H1/5
MSDAAESTTASAAKAAKSPKKKGTSKPKKPSAHPKYSQMIKEAISGLKERGGSSRQAILKYIMKHYNVGKDEKTVNSHLKLALRAGVKNSTLKQAKGTGATGRFAVGAKKESAKPKKVRKPKAAKKPKKAKKAPKEGGVKKVKKAASKKVKKAKSPKKVKVTGSAPKVKKAKSPKKTASKTKKPKASAKPKKASVKKATAAAN